MALARWQSTIVDGSGDTQSLASVEVRRESDNSLISLYTDRAGTISAGNPILADSEGYAYFHAAGGAYKITATKGAFSRVWRYVGVGIFSEADSMSDTSSISGDPSTFYYPSYDLFGNSPPVLIAGTGLVHRFNRVFIGASALASSDYPVTTPDWVTTAFGLTGGSQLMVTSTIGTLSISSAIRTSDYRTWAGASADGGAQSITGFAYNDDIGPSSVVTITIASPGVVTWTSHGLVANDSVQFTTTGALPTGLLPAKFYFVKTVLGANTFTLSATAGGTVIATTGSQSGVHTMYKSRGTPVACGIVGINAHRVGCSGVTLHQLDTNNLGAVLDATPTGDVMGGQTYSLLLTPGAYTALGTLNNVSVGLAIGGGGSISNPTHFRKGIVVFVSGLDTTLGSGGAGVAMEMARGQDIRWLNSTDTVDATMWGDANGLNINTGSTLKVLASGGLEMTERTAPSAGAVNTVRIYAQDNGNSPGKTQLMALFNTGVAQQIAIEP